MREIALEMREAFTTKVGANWDRIVDSLIELAVVRGDVRAHKLLLEHGLGRPRESSPPPANSLMQELILRGLASYKAEVEPLPDVVETTAREIE